MKVYTTSFETYESQVREQLQSLLGQHGFDHERDIGAITVNRWPHGYAYFYVTLDDPDWPEGKARRTRSDGRNSGASPSPTRTPKQVP